MTGPQLFSIIGSVLGVGLALLRSGDPPVDDL